MCGRGKKAHLIDETGKRVHGEGGAHDEQHCALGQVVHGAREEAMRQLLAKAARADARIGKTTHTRARTIRQLSCAHMHSQAQIVCVCGASTNNHLACAANEPRRRVFSCAGRVSSAATARVRTRRSQA